MLSIFILDENGNKQPYDTFRLTLSDEVREQVDKAAKLLSEGNLKASSQVDFVGEGSWTLRVRDQGKWRRVYIGSFESNTPPPEFFTGSRERTAGSQLLVVGEQLWNSWESTSYNRMYDIKTYAEKLSPNEKQLFLEVVAKIKSGEPSVDYTTTTSGKTVYINANRPAPNAVSLALQLNWTS